MGPRASGDWPMYSMIADNLLRGCGIAVTAPDGGCLPHFGGNQLPLYLLVVAALCSVFGQSEDAVRIAQGLLAAAANAWLALAVLRVTEDSFVIADDDILHMARRDAEPLAQTDLTLSIEQSRTIRMLMALIEFGATLRTQRSG